VTKLQPAPEQPQAGAQVIVENGGAAFSFDWELVQPQVAQFTRICTYDRAGYAWSDPGPKFDTFDQATHDLHLLLMNAGIRGPYVLVGHSLGGVLVRFYQAKYPTDVVGIVLVDSSHEESLQHVGMKVARIPELTAKQFQNLIEEAKANRPKNPEPDLVPTTIFPPYDKTTDPVSDFALVGTEEGTSSSKGLGTQSSVRFELPSRDAGRNAASSG
jgi:pimeloyl-ACP methyl ester carboxylesterase